MRSSLVRVLIPFFPRQPKSICVRWSSLSEPGKPCFPNCGARSIFPSSRFLTRGPSNPEASGKRPVTGTSPVGRREWNKTMPRFRSRSTTAAERSNALPWVSADRSLFRPWMPCTSQATVAAGPRSNKVATSNSNQAPSARIAQRLSAFDTD
ncbi:hypothetical protein D3C84_794880 [compost metagenome]